jgi:glucosamine-phosphate N-acetyltransferase
MQGNGHAIRVRPDQSKARLCELDITLDDGQCIGGAGLIIVETPSGTRAYVDNVYVKPEFRDQGLGSKLVDMMITVARDMGCYKIVLACDETRVGFYERLGFCRHQQAMRIDVKRGSSA